MCKVMEDMIRQTLLDVAKKMLEDGSLTTEKIAEFVGLPIDEIRSFAVNKTV